MPVRESGGVFNEQVLTGSLAHYVICGADFSGAIDSYGHPVPHSAAEIIFTRISEGAYINIMNPNDINLSFALEAGRSIWDEISLTAMVQSLGTNVGVDNIDCSVCTVKRVPYIWGCGSGTASTFLELTDTPASYAGYAGYVVAVDSLENGLIFTPATASNAFSSIASPTQPTINAVGSDTVTFVAGSGIHIVTNSLTKTITISRTGGGGTTATYIPVISGSTLAADTKYIVTDAGTVYLPSLTGLTAGQFVTVTKTPGNTIFVNVNDALTETISTDLGITDSIEMDSTEEAVYIFNGTQWALQIGSQL